MGIYQNKTTNERMWKRVRWDSPGVTSEDMMEQWNKTPPGCCVSQLLCYKVQVTIKWVDIHSAWRTANDCARKPQTYAVRNGKKVGGKLKTITQMRQRSDPLRSKVWGLHPLPKRFQIKKLYGLLSSLVQWLFIRDLPCFCDTSSLRLDFAENLKKSAFMKN